MDEGEKSEWWMREGWMSGGELNRVKEEDKK